MGEMGTDTRDVDAEDAEAIAIARTSTDPLPLNVGDRIAIERRIDKLETKVDQHVAERDKQTQTFYETRMVPLERNVERKSRLIWFTMGIATAALVFAAATAGASIVAMRLVMTALNSH